MPQFLNVFIEINSILSIQFFELYFNFFESGLIQWKFYPIEFWQFLFEWSFCNFHINQFFKNSTHIEAAILSFLYRNENAEEIIELDNFLNIIIITSAKKIIISKELNYFSEKWEMKELLLLIEYHHLLYLINWINNPFIFLSHSIQNEKRFCQTNECKTLERTCSNTILP